MTDQQITTAICKITCDEEIGTGWIISKGCVLTARHVVLAAIEKGSPITVTFDPTSEDLTLPAIIETHDPSADACLLKVDTGEIDPLPFSSLKPREGSDWHSFGYPISRLPIGHRLTGTIERVFPLPQLKVDLDLVIDPSRALNQYHGVSGSPLFCDGKVVGLLRLQIDRLPAAISIAALKTFLEPVINF